MIFARLDSLLAQPAGDPPRVRNRQAVNDAVTGKLWNELSQPREPFALIAEADAKEFQRGACERPTLHAQIPNLGHHILDYAVVGRRRSANHRHFRRQRLQDANYTAIVRSKIMSPVRNAVCFIYNKQADAVLNAR